MTGTITLTRGAADLGSQLAWSGDYNGPNFGYPYGGFAVLTYVTPGS